MLEVVFSESAKGSILLAQHCADSVIGEASSLKEIGFIAEEGESVQDARRAAQGYTRRAQQRSASLGGCRQDVYCIADFPNYGPLENGMYGSERLAFLQSLSVWPGQEAKFAPILEKARDDLGALLRRIEAGESVRIWYSDSPDEACGLLRLCAEIEALSSHGGISAVHQPAYIENAWGVAEPNPGWGGVAPGLWASFAPLAVPFSERMLRHYAEQWHALCQSESCLRAVVNGRVQGVDDSFYDGFLLDVIDTLPQEFREAEAIDRVLSRGLCVSDGWLALRIGKMIEAEIFVPLTQAPADRPRYQRTLKKADL